MKSNTALLEILKEAKKVIPDELYNNSLNDLENTLIENIREEVAKSKGNKNPLKVVKDIMKDNNKTSSKQSLFNYHEFEYKGNIYKGFTNNCYCVASYDDFGYKKEEDSVLRMNQIFEEYENTDKEFEIDIKDLKTFIKLHGKEKIPYILEKEDFKIAFNPKYLLNVISFTENNIIKVNKSITPAYTYSEDMSKIALVLPIKINN